MSQQALNPNGQEQFQQGQAQQPGQQQQQQMQYQQPNAQYIIPIKADDQNYNDEFAKYVPSADEWNNAKQIPRENMFVQTAFNNYDQGQYYGASIQGVRHGKGKCTYQDGSMYDGNWVNGVRQGLGKQSNIYGYYYDGQWQNNLKEGKGVEQLPTGEIFDTEWSQDRKMGEGFYKKNQLSKQIKATWNWDLLIPETNQQQTCPDHWYLNVILILLVAIFIVAAIFIKAEVAWGAVISYILMIIETYFSKTQSYTTLLKPFSEIREMLQKTIDSKPQITFTLQNWHYDKNRRNQMTVGKDGDTTYNTETETVRINGSFHRDPFLYKAWVDLSPPKEALDYISKMPLTRLGMIKSFEFSPIAESSFYHQKYSFIKKNREKGDQNNYDFEKKELLESDWDKFLLYDTNQELPWFVNNKIYWTLSVFCLGWMQRIILLNNSKYAEYHVRKYIYE